MKIGIISDTHGFLDPKVFTYFKECHEVWHIGDFGSGVAEKLSSNFKLRGVYGNIDDSGIRNDFPEHVFFELDGLKILMIHIGGYPEKYTAKAKKLILELKPDVFLSGHSHICKVMRDKKLGLLHLNPGAAGNHGFHNIKTIMRLEIINSELKNLQVIELGSREMSQP